MYKFMIVDDYPIIRHGIIQLIQKSFTNSVFKEARDAAECKSQLAAEHFDIVILDIGLPGNGTEELVDWIKHAGGNSRVLIFTINDTEFLAARYYRKGVLGYVTKEMDSKDVLMAIDHVLQGRLYVHQKYQGILPRLLAHSQKQSGIDTLSGREAIIARALANGQSYEEIASQLDIDINTVRTFKSRIFKKLNVKTLVDFLHVFHYSFD